jgi:hypothetical protein
MLITELLHVSDTSLVATRITKAILKDRAENHAASQHDTYAAYHAHSAKDTYAITANHDVDVVFCLPKYSNNKITTRNSTNPYRIGLC